MPIQFSCTPSMTFNYHVPPLCLFNYYVPPLFHSITLYPLYAIQLPCTPSMAFNYHVPPLCLFNYPVPPLCHSIIWKNLQESCRRPRSGNDFHVFTGWTWKRVNGKFWKAALHLALFQSLFKKVCSICQLSHVWHIHINFSCKYVAVYPDSRDF